MPPNGPQRARAFLSRIARRITDRDGVRLVRAKQYWNAAEEEQALGIAARLQARAGRPEARFRAGLHHLSFQLSPVYRDEAHLHAARAAYRDTLARLAAAAAETPGAARGLARGVQSIGPYYLPYHGTNEVESQRLYGTMMARALAETYPRFARPPAMPPDTGRLRVGIASDHIHAHSNWTAITSGWIDALDPARFDLHIYSLGTKADSRTDHARNRATRFVSGQHSFERWCETIAGDRLHALLYPSIGTFSLVTKLALLRLAPVQCVGAGHCITSGFPTIDYFLSSAIIEPEDGDDHYTERLIRLPGLGVRYKRPHVWEHEFDRSRFGLRESACVVLSPHMLTKYMPQHDRLYPRIARGIGDCQIVFVRMLPRLAEHSLRFERRMRAAFEAEGVDWDRHALVLDRMGPRAFSALQQFGDVFLDSIGWNGGVTSSIALAHDLPMVTLAGPVFRNRMGMGMLRLIGLTETIAETPDDFVRIATRLGRDPAWRAALRTEIRARRDPIYSGMAGVGLAAFLDETLSAAAGGPAPSRRPPLDGNDEAPHLVEHG